MKYYNHNSLYTHTADSGFIIISVSVFSVGYHQGQISLLHQQWQQPQMLPAGMSVQEEGPWESGHPNGPQNTSNDEAQMAMQARQKIQARLKIAKLFQQYR